MDTKDRLMIEQEAVIRYGDAHQKMKCLEEMTELSKEICKDLIGEGNRDHILEELADLMITLDEISIIYGFTIPEVNLWLDSKVERLKKRMDAEETIEHADETANMEMVYDK